MTSVAMTMSANMAIAIQSGPCAPATTVCAEAANGHVAISAAKRYPIIGRTSD
jgi:hypothetical protein